MSLKYTCFYHETIEMPSATPPPFLSTKPGSQGYLTYKKTHPLGPYRKPMPRVTGGWAFSYERGAPVVASIPRGEFRE